MDSRKPQTKVETHRQHLPADYLKDHPREKWLCIISPAETGSIFHGLGKTEAESIFNASMAWRRHEDGRSGRPGGAKGIATQIHAALDAAHKENEYPHDFSRSAADTALEINDWSGIEGFNRDNRQHLAEATNAVREWRARNPTIPRK